MWALQHVCADAAGKRFACVSVIVYYITKSPEWPVPDQILQETIMTTEFNLKFKAFTAALAINLLLLGSAAYLFDGRIHSPGHFATVVAQIASLATSKSAVLPQG
jgi:hypothetical protein